MIHATLLSIVLGVTVALSKTYGPGPAPGLVPPADTVRRSSDWLALSPDGEEKRRFLLDCTGCHQIDDQIARPGGRARTPAEFEERVTQMLSFAGSTTGFPVIGHGREAASAAAWLARHLVADPTIRPRGALPPNSRITEYEMPEPGDLPHDVAVGSDGRVVITGMFSHRMWVLGPASKTFDAVDIPVDKANPRALELDAAGDWWSSSALDTWLRATARRPAMAACGSTAISPTRRSSSLASTRRFGIPPGRSPKSKSPRIRR